MDCIDACGDVMERNPSKDLYFGFLVTVSKPEKVENIRNAVRGWKEEYALGGAELWTFDEFKGKIGGAPTSSIREAIEAYARQNPETARTWDAVYNGGSGEITGIVLVLAGESRPDVEHATEYIPRQLPAVDSYKTIKYGDTLFAIESLKENKKVVSPSQAEVEAA